MTEISKFYSSSFTKYIEDRIGQHFIKELLLKGLCQKAESKTDFVQSSSIISTTAKIRKIVNF